MKLRVMILGLGLLLLLAIPAVASAEVRTVNATDPADATPTISGVPNNPDISSVSVSYDTAGSLTLTVNFYNALNALDTSENFDFYGNFAIGVGQEVYGDPTHCGSSGTEPGDLTGQNHVYSSVGTSFFNQASVTGSRANCRLRAQNRLTTGASP